METQRIQSSIDIHRMLESHVVMVGGAYGLVRDLAHCGLGSVTLLDFDRIEPSNVARQDFHETDIGRYKVEACAAVLKRLNPEMRVTCVVRDFCELTPAEIDQIVGPASLLIMSTDSFPAQARGNIEAIRLRKPAIWIGMYREGRAGEIMYYQPGKGRACFRCICADRYRLFESGAATGSDPTKVSSAGGTIFDMRFADAVAGAIAIGLITAGAANRMGRLIEQLGDRNLMQVKLDPLYTLRGKDLFGQHLGTSRAAFNWNTIALAIAPDPNCPDCAEARRDEERESCATSSGGM